MSRYTLPLLLLPILFSCIQKELCYGDDSTVTGTTYVAFNWDKNSTTSPQGMRVLFYPVEGGAPIVEHITGSEGGYVDIPAGNYHMVCHNNDTESLLWRGEDDLSTIEAYTRSGELIESYTSSLYATDADSMSMTIPPDCMWVDTLMGVTVASDTAAYQEIQLYPNTTTPLISYEVSVVENGANISLIRATLSGIAGSHFIGIDSLDTTPYLHPEDGELVAPDYDTIEGEFYCFGHTLTDSTTHYLTLHLWTTSDYITRSYDVTEQLATASDPYRVHIVITDTIDAGSNESGFQPSVESWGESNEQDIWM